MLTNGKTPIVISDKKNKKRKRSKESLNDTELLQSKESKKKRRDQSSTNDDMTHPARPSSSEEEIVPPAPASSAASPAKVTEFLTKHSIAIHMPDGMPMISPVLSFRQLDIPSDLQSSFEGFKEPTPIQACTWPLALQGLDVVGIAETGR